MLSLAALAGRFGRSLFPDGILRRLRTKGPVLFPGGNVDALISPREGWGGDECADSGLELRVLPANIGGEVGSILDPIAE